MFSARFLHGTPQSSPCRHSQAIDFIGCNLIVVRSDYLDILGHVNATQGNTAMKFQKNGFTFQFNGLGTNGATWLVTYNGAFFAKVSTAAVIRAMQS
jgi:hypothetical protein